MYGKFGIKLLDLNIIHFCVASSILFNQLALLLRETHNTFGARWLDHTRSTLSTRVLELADCFLLQHDSDKFHNLSIMFPYRFSSFVHHFPVMFPSTFSSGRCRVMQRVPGDLKTLQELISSGHVVNAGRGQHISVLPEGVRWHNGAARCALARVRWHNVLYVSKLFVRGNWEWFWMILISPFFM